MFVRHDARARETGARIVHAAGFDSIPHDLGAYFTVAAAARGRAADRRRVRARRAACSPAAPSPPRSPRWLARPADAGAPRRTAGCTSRGWWGGGRARRSARPGSARETGRVGAAAADHRRRRSWPARRARCARYGPDFRYRHYAAVKTLPDRGGRRRGASARSSALAQVPAARRWLVRPAASRARARARRRRAKSWFSVRFVGEGGGAPGLHGGRRAATPATARRRRCSPSRRCAWPSTTCPATSGQVTTAVAMGDALIERLRAAGITFRVAASRDARASRLGPSRQRVDHPGDPGQSGDHREDQSGRHGTLDGLGGAGGGLRGSVRRHTAQPADHDDAPTSVLVLSSYSGTRSARTRQGCPGSPSRSPSGFRPAVPFRPAAQGVGAAGGLREAVGRGEGEGVRAGVVEAHPVADGDEDRLDAVRVRSARPTSSPSSARSGGGTAARRCRGRRR